MGQTLLGGIPPAVQGELEINRPPQGRMEKGRGRGLRVEGKRPTVLHTQPQDDMDGFSRHALLLARQDALLTYTARLCQEKWDSFCTALDFGPPPPSAEPESSPKDMSTASEDQPNQVSSTLQGVLDHHHTAEDHGHPTWTEPPSDTGLEPVGETTSGLLQDHPDQPNLVPSACDTGNTPSVPLEATREPPTLPVGDDTITPTDNYDWGYPSRQGHIADGSDTDRLQRDSVYSEPKGRTDPLPCLDALHQPVSLIDLEK